MSFMPAPLVWNRRNVGWFIHTIVIGAAGAISSQDLPGDSGIVAAKTAATTGRYTLTAPGKGFRKFKGGFVSITGPDTAAWGATSTGFDAFFRAEHMDDATNPPTVLLQFMNGSANADAEVPNPTTVTVFICVEF